MPAFPRKSPRPCPAALAQPVSALTLPSFFLQAPLLMCECQTATFWALRWRVGCLRGQNPSQDTVFGLVAAEGLPILHFAVQLLALGRWEGTSRGPREGYETSGVPAMHSGAAVMQARAAAGQPRARPHSSRSSCRREGWLAGNSQQSPLVQTRPPAARLSRLLSLPPVVQVPPAGCCGSGLHCWPLGLCPHSDGEP